MSKDAVKPTKYLVQSSVATQNCLYISEPDSSFFIVDTDASLVG